MLAPVDPAASRHVRAIYTDDSLLVYQAFSPAIADPALGAQSFIAPFSLSRMTWIKPSFLWMMYRSGWATKAGQERVLAIEVSRQGFEWALRHSCLSQYEPAVHSNKQEWAARVAACSVRVQWDPDRDVHLRPQPARAIQVGLSGEALRQYLNSWIRSIRDVTDEAHAVHALIEAGRLGDAQARLPKEACYPLPSDLRSLVGAD
jgi:Domain of unknown function (DUF4291)